MPGHSLVVPPKSRHEGAFSHQRHPGPAILGRRKNSWNPSTKHLLEHTNHHFQLVWHYRRHRRAPVLTQVTRGQTKPPGEEAGRGSAQLPPTAGTRAPTLPCVPHPLVSQGQQHTAREGPSLSQPHSVETGTPASSPAPAENICCSQLAAKCHGLASAQPELVLYEPLIALKHKVLIPSTLPLLYKGYSSAPTGSVPFPSKLKLAADSKLCCTASRVPMLSPSTSGSEQQAAQCNWKEGARGCHRQGSLLRASQGSFPLCSSINSVPNKPLQAPCGIREIPTQLQTSPKLLSQWENTTEVQATSLPHSCRQAEEPSQKVGLIT